MQIWVDADACPRGIREILFKAAARTGVPVTLVANAPVQVPASRRVRAVQVPGGFDVADDYIAERAAAGDLVVTADVPLAAQVVASGAVVIDPRGELLNGENIGERASVRDFMHTLRSAGQVTGGPPPLSARDRQRFANALDRLLAQRPDRG
ncbi:MAG: YaiI/YqxD family protein [Pseudomonadota bacterium]|nr:YaiI/YqxD family protein [Pseudomonadota bacterium]